MHTTPKPSIIGRNMHRHARRVIVAGLAVVASVAMSGLFVGLPHPLPLTKNSAFAQSTEGPSRFASLKFNEVRLRRGPGLEYPMDWIYKREGLPVQLLNEYENWLQIRDFEGTTGWVNRSQLSSHRTVIVIGSVPRVMKREDSESSATIARLEPGVIADVTQCGRGDDAWCRLEKGDLRGWVRVSELWGIGADEIAADN